MEHHGRGLRAILQKQGRDLAVAGQLETGYRDAALSEAERCMLEYADKLTRTPSAMIEPDVASLRSVGFGDAAIHDICAVSAYFAFVNRIANGLGVDLETDELESDA